MKRLISKHNIAKAVFGMSLGIVALTSCSGDFLDRIPTDAVSSNIFWKTETDADLALTGCYRQLYSPYRPEERWFWDTASDNAFCYHNNKDWRAIGNGTMASAGVSVHNYFTYIELRTCNEYLKMENTINFTTEEKRQQYRDEVRIIRALCLFFRIEAYGDYPFSEDVYETAEEAMVGRVDKSTLLEYIHKELTDIISRNYLPKTVVPGRISIGAAKAFLIRYDMFTKNYDEAISTAKSMMADGTYSMPELTYEQSFLKANQNNSEVIMSFEHNKAGGFGMWVFEFLPNNYGGWSSVVPTHSLLDSYEMKNGMTIDEAGSGYDATNPYVNRDPRLRATIVYPGQTWGMYSENGYKSCEKGSGDYATDADNATKTGLTFKKFYGDLSEYPDPQSCDRNFPIFRYAEVLLSYAEAKIEKNDIDQTVYDAINAVRRRAGMPDVDQTKYGNQTALRTLVHRERRVEFAYEGMRRFDLIRWGELAKALDGQQIYHTNGTVSTKKNAEGDYDVNIKPFDAANDVVETRHFTTNKNELLPVPQTVIDVNPNISQNPGY